MVKPKLQVPLDRFLVSTKKLDQIQSGSADLTPAIQKLVAELVVLRLFDDFQTAVKGSALRLTCGATYVDGTSPKLLVTPAPSTAAAEHILRNHGRNKQAKLNWSKASSIVNSVKFAVDPTDHFCVTMRNLGTPIAEVVAVRNRIAHNNSSSRKAYSNIVKRRYGASQNHITPGILLVSDRFSPPLVEQYIASLRTVIRTALRA